MATKAETPVDATPVKNPTFYERLAKVQLSLKAPKSRKNDFAGFNYRNLEDILEGVKPLLMENGLYLVLEDSIEQIGDRYYVKATATVGDVDSEKRISNSAYAREALEKKKSDEAQITGAASSYARKYALNGLFLIDDTKTEPPTEIDAEDHTDKETKKQAEPPKQDPAKELINDAEVKRLEALMAPNQINFVLKHCEATKLSELTKKQYTEVINGLKRNAEAKGKD